MAIGTITSTGKQNGGGSKSKYIRLYQNKTSERPILGSYQNSLIIEVDEEDIDSIDKLKNYIIRKGNRCVYERTNDIVDFYYISISSLFPSTGIVFSPVLAARRTSSAPYESWNASDLCFPGLKSGESTFSINIIGSSWNLEYVEV